MSGATKKNKGQGVSTRHSVRLWSGDKQMFTFTAPDRGAADWIGRCLLNRSYQRRVVDRYEILYKLDVVRTVKLADVRKTPRVEEDASN